MYYFVMSLDLMSLALDLHLDLLHLAPADYSLDLLALHPLPLHLPMTPADYYLESEICSVLDLPHLHPHLHPHLREALFNFLPDNLLREYPNRLLTNDWVESTTIRTIRTIRTTNFTNLLLDDHRQVLHLVFLTILYVLHLLVIV
jgi:hypothetical protein